MNTDPGIICFQHCESKVFCFTLPECCPVCKGNVDTADFQLPPFRVPYPFVRAVQYPCCIVIKPTCGSFLNDYLNSMDLHIGVTDSKGAVVEFDRNGLQRSNSQSWNQCLVLDFTNDFWPDEWDETLKKVASDNQWTSQRYNELKFNCYSFVLTFLANLHHEKLGNSTSCKTIFCEKYIVPHTTAAAKYISLYRKLLQAKYFIQHTNTQDSNYS